MEGIRVKRSEVPYSLRVPGQSLEPTTLSLHPKKLSGGWGWGGVGGRWGRRLDWFARGWRAEIAPTTTGFGAAVPLRPGE